MSDTCPNCGEAIKSTDVFCPYCGATRSDQSSSADQSSSLQCTNCGASNDFGVSFCQSCGQPLGSAKETPPPPIDAPGQTQESYDYGTYSTTSSTGERKWYQPPPRTRSKKNPIEWFFCTCWGIYVVFRALFQILWCVGMIAGRRR